MNRAHPQETIGMPAPAPRVVGWLTNPNRYQEDLKNISRDLIDRHNGLPTRRQRERGRNRSRVLSRSELLTLRLLKAAGYALEPDEVLFPELENATTYT